MSTKMSLLAGSLLIILALAAWKRWRVRWGLRPRKSWSKQGLLEIDVTWMRCRPSSAPKARPGRVPGLWRRWVASRATIHSLWPPKSSGGNGTGSTDGFKS
ncbi:hypothetical protein LCGC14_1278350 [marine sediment metagenome]|uniref:Uncharacterized protein n=1 Tax=marine sediment metagenome TaxID=412755 RepID=A0A0F9NZ28_9ZZZZ